MPPPGQTRGNGKRDGERERVGSAHDGEAAGAIMPVHGDGLRGAARAGFGEAAHRDGWVGQGSGLLLGVCLLQLLTRYILPFIFNCRYKS